MLSKTLASIYKDIAIQCNKAFTGNVRKLLCSEDNYIRFEMPCQSTKKGAWRRMFKRRIILKTSLISRTFHTDGHLLLRNFFYIGCHGHIHNPVVHSYLGCYPSYFSSIPDLLQLPSGATTNPKLWGSQGYLTQFVGNAVLWCLSSVKARLFLVWTL